MLHFFITLEKKTELDSRHMLFSQHPSQLQKSAMPSMLIVVGSDCICEVSSSQSTQTLPARPRQLLWVISEMLHNNSWFTFCSHSQFMVSELDWLRGSGSSLLTLTPCWQQHVTSKLLNMTHLSSSFLSLKGWSGFCPQSSCSLAWGVWLSAFGSGGGKLGMEENLLACAWQSFGETEAFS